MVEAAKWQSAWYFLYSHKAGNPFIKVAIVDDCSIGLVFAGCGSASQFSRSCAGMLRRKRWQVNEGCGADLAVSNGLLVKHQSRSLT
jgi:hypothetical protein